MSVTVKSVYGDDIRRFVVSNNCSFEDFASQIREAYGLENARFSVRFLDDEDELITVTTDAGLQEALSLAVSGFVKILKFQVHLLPESKLANENKVPDVKAVPMGKTATSKAPENPPDKSGPKTPVLDSRPLQASATPFTSTKQSAPENREPPCKLEVFRLLRALVRDPEVSKILPSVIQVFQSSLMHPNTSLQQVIDHILGAYPLVKNHPSIVALSPWIPSYVPKLEHCRQKLCQMAANFPCLLQTFDMSNFGNFFGGENPFDDNEEQEDDECDRESGASTPNFGHWSQGPFCGPTDVHLGVSCDNCGMKPIQGIRYKCSVCSNYDLCSACEASDCHPAEHPLIKTRAPSGAPSLPGAPPPFGGPFGPPFPHFNPAAWAGMPFPPGFGPFRGRKCRMKWPFANGMTRQESRCWRAAQPLQATFVRECNLQDRTEVCPNKTLVKIWELQNSGAMAWPAGTKLTYARGDLPSVENSFDVAGPVEPGKTVQVSAVVRTPSNPGRYRAFFKLEDNQNNRFGPRLWCDVTVVVPNSASQVPEPDPVPCAGDEPCAGEEAEACEKACAEEVAAECKEVIEKCAAALDKCAAAQAFWEKEEVREAAEKAEKLRKEVEECTVVHAEPKPPAECEGAAKYQTQLAELHSLGFTNDDLNVYLLDQHQGNVESVCAWLLEQQCSD